VGGTIVDPSGSAVPNAKITVTNMHTNAESSGISDDAGRFAVPQLPPGSYVVQISSQGFNNYRQENVIVEIGRTTAIDAALAVGTQAETISVTAEAPVIIADRPDFSTNINEVTMDNQPVLRRRWSTFALATPGAVADGTFGLISFRGISGLLNNNTVDGGDNNQAFFAEEKGRTRASYSISEASIQEFQVNTSNYSAEYGRSAGGVVNAITRSGTNGFHGEAFWFYDTSDLSATNPFATIVLPSTLQTVPVKPPDKRHQFGGSLGGPVVKDKLFWFFSGDHQTRNFPAVANAQNAALFFAPLSSSELATLAGRGISVAQANTGFAFLQTLTGVTPRIGDETLLFPKLDWVITPNHHVSVEYNRMRWSSPGGVQSTGAVIFRGKESFGDDFVKDDTVVARLTSTLSSNISNEARFTYGRDFEFETGQPAIPGEPVSQQLVSPQVVINPGSILTFGKPNFLNRYAYPDEKNYQPADTISINHGQHLFRAGFDVNRVHELLDNLFQESGAYSYNTRVDYISDYVAAVNHFATPVCLSGSSHVGCYATLGQNFGPRAFQFDTTDIGLFFQDDWRLSQRLTLNLGLRWEFEKMPSPQIPNPLLAATSNFPSDKNNFGPRVGAAWDLTGRGKSILRGGYGIYYGRIINSTISNAITNTGVKAGQLQFTFQPNAAGSPLYPNVATTAPPPSATPPDVVVFAADTQNPMIHEFDVTFEQQIATNTAISVSYLGSLGRDLPVFIDANLPQPNASIIYKVSGGSFDGQTFTEPLFVTPTVGATSRPNPNFGRITTISDIVSSKYNALVVQFNRRMTSGLQVQSSYTFSNASDDGQSSQTFTSSNNVLNPFNLGLEQGPSNFDTRHRFGASVVWQPEYFKTGSPLAHLALDGFTIAPVVSAASGATYTGTVSGNAPAPAGFKPIFNGSILGAGGSTRAPFIKRNAFNMPRSVNVDLRVAKKFQYRERFDFEMFVEAFNLFNHVNVTAVRTGQYVIGAGAGTAASPAILTFDPTFGVPSASFAFYSTQRQVQIGAKVHF